MKVTKMSYLIAVVLAVLAGLAVYLGFNIEHFAFGEGLGAMVACGAIMPPVMFCVLSVAR